MRRRFFALRTSAASAPRSRKKSRWKWLSIITIITIITITTTIITITIIIITTITTITTIITTEVALEARASGGARGR